MIKYPACQHAIGLTSTKSTPPPSGLATQDIPPTDTTTTALPETKG
jgi:hypothetical protein